MPRSRVGRRGAGLIVAGSAAALIIGPLLWLWQASLLPSSYSATGMGYPDLGGGPPMASAMGSHGDAAAGPMGASVSVADLVTDRQRSADVSVTLVARAERFTLESGRSVDGFSLNGQSPGPEIRARVGQLVEVRLVNESVPDGATLHWHGVDLPNGEDGVAGITQDAVGIGEDFTYRFVAHQAGTFWYHSHQVSHIQVRRGLLGALVIEPAEPAAQTAEPDSPVLDVPAQVTRDVVALVHLYDGTRTVNGLEGDIPVALDGGERVRVRVINSDNGPMSVWVAGAPFRLIAVDGTDLSGPTEVAEQAVLVTAGGRADLEVVAPQDGSSVRVHLGGPSGIVLVPAPDHGSAPSVSRPDETLDLLSYGTPAPIDFDPDRPDRVFRYDIGRRPGFLNGRPGVWWTINGHMYPDVPMFVVAEGDVVRMTIANHSGEVHPMHLHGHHAVVLSRDGQPSSGSPWWIDSLNVGNGESYEIAFVADNPGVWMDHCHNLPHAREGLVTHLMYDGVTTPYLIGGPGENQPE